MSYRISVNQQLDSIFASCEKHRICYIPSTNAISKAISVRLNSGELVKPFRGMYARASYWAGISLRERTRHIIRTLSHKYPSWVFSHSSAALIHNLEVPYNIMLPLHYLSPRSSNGSGGKNIKHHRTVSLMGQNKDGAQVTSVEQTVVDCAASYSFELALPIVDSALHQGLTDKNRLSGYLQNRSSLRGARNVRRIINLADCRADNGGESYVRALILQCGLPQPELQVPIPNPDMPGHFYYADFLFTREDGVKVDFELDGREKYTNPAMTNNEDMLAVMMRERQREAAITSSGIRILRMGFADASNPSVLLRKLAHYKIVPLS